MDNSLDVQDLLNDISNSQQSYPRENLLPELGSNCLPQSEDGSSRGHSVCAIDERHPQPSLWAREDEDLDDYGMRL